MNKLPLETSGIKLKFVLENVSDKPKLQTTKTVVSSLYGSKMTASQIRVKISNNDNSQRITVLTMRKASLLLKVEILGPVLKLNPE